MDLLAISHTDKDHYDDLPNFLEALGPPIALLRNKTLPDFDKYGALESAHQQAYKKIDDQYIANTPSATDPLDLNNNGGVEIWHGMLDRNSVSNINDSSIVLIYFYGGVSFIFPGDIEESGWDKLYQSYGPEIQSIFNKSNTRILVAPHHGRKSGFSKNMMAHVSPHFTVVSDKTGDAETDRRFRELPHGIKFVGGNIIKYASTKTDGRIRFSVNETGLTHADWG